MADWNMIRYITDKIGQGEDPAEIKKKLIENGYDQKLINESFTQAIPWLKPQDQEKIKTLQTQATQSTVTNQPITDQSVQQAQIQKPIETVSIPIKTEESEPITQPSQEAIQEVKTSAPNQEKKPIWLYVSIIVTVIILILIAYFVLR